MQLKGIKRGNTIELLEEVDIPDGQEVLIELELNLGFWESLKRFREEIDLDLVDLDDPVFEEIRDRSPGREVVL